MSNFKKGFIRSTILSLFFDTYYTFAFFLIIQIAAKVTIT